MPSSIFGATLRRIGTISFHLPAMIFWFGMDAPYVSLPSSKPATTSSYLFEATHSANSTT